MLRTYRIFLGVLAAIAGLGLISYWTLPTVAWSALSAADGFLWVLCGWFGWRKPIGVTLTLFTLVTGLMMGPLAHQFGAIFLLTTVVTFVAFGALTVYAPVTRRDFSFLLGFLNVSFFILLGYCFFGFLITIPFIHILFAAFGTLVFMAWLLFDTSRILLRTAPDLTPAIAAFELLLDIIGLHSWLMELFDEV